MSDFELDPNDPRDPEYEYAPSSWQKQEESSYRTGSTTPPKDYGSVVAAVLVLMIFFGGLSSAMSLLNIRLFHVSAEAQAEEDPVTFVSGGSVAKGLEATEAALETDPTEATTSLENTTAILQIAAPPQASQTGTGEEGQAEETTADQSLSWREVYSKVIPSVVSITCTSDSATSSGTGVVMTKNGYIITNAHVVEGYSCISVLLTDGRTFDALVVGSDSVSDLAVLYVQATDLTPAEFGDSSVLQVGDEVVAIGDPLGVERRGTLTDGIISGINRDVVTGGRTMNLIQTTAALNSGNSGGPLVNCYGQVIGINTMKIGDTASSAGVEGLGFAIPMSTVKDVVEQLVSHGYVAGRPTLGIEGQMVSNFYQYYYRLPTGMLITNIDEDSDAAAKGLQTGDIILYANSRQITSTSALSEVVNSCQVGDTITVVVYRSGREYTVELTVSEAKN